MCFTKKRNLIRVHYWLATSSTRKLWNITWTLIFETLGYFNVVNYPQNLGHDIPVYRGKIVFSVWEINSVFLLALCGICYF